MAYSGSGISYQVLIECDNVAQIANRTYPHKNLQTEIEITVYGLQLDNSCGLSVVALFNIDNRNYPSMPSDPVFLSTHSDIGMI